MSIMDDARTYRPGDVSRVDLHDRLDLDFWCREFGCRPDQLRLAVESVGPSASRVRDFLRRHGWAQAESRPLKA